jgi:hypothetical protein
MERFCHAEHALRCFEELFFSVEFKQGRLEANIGMDDFR